MRRRPCRRSYRPAPENRSRSRSDCSSKNCCHASCVCPYRSPQKLSFISARKCWKCSVIGIIFAIGCRSPFRKGFSLRGQSQLTPSCFLHNQSYVTWHLRFWGDHFSASVARPVEIAGQVVVPAGAEARGRIVEAVPQGRFNVPLPLRKEAQSMRMAVNACAVTKAVLLRNCSGTFPIDEVALDF